MSNKFTFILGILGVSLFVGASVLGGILIDNYNFTSQFISETYAIDTEYGIAIRVLGYIPSGILLTIFAFLALNKFPKSLLTKIGFYGLGVFYGMATILVGIFPCDSGCNKQLIDPSISQMVHNLAGGLTYIFVPISIIFIGVGLRNSPDHKRLSIHAITYGILSMFLVYILFTNPNSDYIGLYQRFIEALFALWIVVCAFTIKNRSQWPT